MSDYEYEKLDNYPYDTYKISYSQSVNGNLGYVKVYILGCEHEFFMLYATFSDKVSDEKIKSYTKKIEHSLKHIERNSGYMVPSGGYTFHGDGFEVDIPNDMYQTSDDSKTDVCRIAYRSVDSMKLAATTFTICKEEERSYQELAEEVYEKACAGNIYYDIKISKTKLGEFDAMLVERKSGDEESCLIYNSYYINVYDNTYSVTCCYDETLEETEVTVIQNIMDTIKFNSNNKDV